MSISVLPKSLRLVPDGTVVRKLPLLDNLNQPIESDLTNNPLKILVMVKYNGVPPAEFRDNARIYGQLISTRNEPVYDFENGRLLDNDEQRVYEFNTKGQKPAFILMNQDRNLASKELRLLGLLDDVIQLKFSMGDPDPRAILRDQLLGFGDRNKFQVLMFTKPDPDLQKPSQTSQSAQNS